MSTYTDLHNILTETVAVGARPCDRISTQRVRFLNQGNQYWGSFQGAMSSENASMTECHVGTLEATQISCGGTSIRAADLSAIQDISSLRNDLSTAEQTITALCAEVADLRLSVNYLIGNPGSASGGCGCCDGSSCWRRHE